jgi:hypothetical protein
MSVGSCTLTTAPRVLVHKCSLLQCPKTPKLTIQFMHLAMSGQSAKPAVGDGHDSECSEKADAAKSV